VLFALLRFRRNGMTQLCGISWGKKYISRTFFKNRTEQHKFNFGVHVRARMGLGPEEPGD
jgi:hypothetical protein